MSTLSRRFFLSAAAAVPAIGAPAVVAAATALPAIAEGKPAQPDPVIGLAREVEEAYAADAAAYEVDAALDDAHCEWRTKNPMPSFTVSRTRISTERTEDAVIDKIETPLIPPEQRAAEKRALANWKRRLRRWKVKSGFAAAEQAHDETSKRLEDAIDALADAAPTTIAGLIAKARAARAFGYLAEQRLAPALSHNIGALALSLGKLEP